VRRLRRAGVHAIVLGGLLGVVGSFYLAIVFGLGRVPTDGEWTLLGVSFAAAVAGAAAYAACRPWLEELATRLVIGDRRRPDEVVRSIGTRFTRALPLDELLLQLVETLRRGLQLTAAEIWVTRGGVLERTASDPERETARLVVSPAVERVLARTPAGGGGWLRIWLPELLAGRDEQGTLAIPITHAMEVYGVLLVERAYDDPLVPEEEAALAELAAQVGLALRNAQLDSELQASFEELRRQAAQLQDSRARVVAVADAERRRIERDLHDGAQQHLVALAVNLRLAATLSEVDRAEFAALMAELSQATEQALQELRDLAHGIYPSLLLDAGLTEALRAAAGRSRLRTAVRTECERRYAPEVEATTYFCCVEALQNAAKHAGPAAKVSVRTWEAEDVLLFAVSDDGAGFELAQTPRGAGLSNMADRVGAVGGRLTIESKPGQGTRVLGAIPIRS
jgi:signal transduction histidine kinase